jgi:hypothetical protein
MGLDRTTIVVALACASCGGRTAPDLLIGAAQDASGPDVGIDASGRDVGIDASGPDVGIEAAEMVCSTTIRAVKECQEGDPSCCRFDVIWTCGNQNFTVGSACAPQGAVVICPPNDQQLSGPPPMPCHCDDTSALSAFVESRCHPTAVR